MAFKDGFIAFGQGMAGQLPPGMQIEQQVALQEALAASQQGIDAQNRQAAMPGQIAALQAAGVDTRQIPGLAGALEQGGADVANQLLQNPAAPMMQGRQSLIDQQLQVEQQKAQIEQAKLDRQAAADAQARLQKLQPLRTQGRSIENVRTMKNLMANEGRLMGPSPERGAYNSLRGQLLNTMRLMFEAGALQQAELEFFETLLPDASTFSATSQGERMAQLNELEYQLTAKLEDSLLFSGEAGLSVGDFAGRGRTVDELITGGIPGGYQPGTGNAVTRPTKETAPEAIIPPGMPLY